MAGNGKRKYNSYIDDLREGRQPNFPKRLERWIRARESAGTLSVGSYCGAFVLKVNINKAASAGRPGCRAGPAPSPTSRLATNRFKNTKQMYNTVPFFIMINIYKIFM